MNNKKLFKTCIATAILASMSATAMADDEATWKISGWINEGITYYDDGQGSDIAQLGDNGTTLGSRIALTGGYKPENTGLQFGFEVIVEPTAAVDGNSSSPLLSNQDGISNANAFGSGVSLLSNNVYMSGDFGKITIGTQSMPTDNIAVLADPSVTIWSGISPLFRMLGFSIRGVDATAGNQTWGNFAQCAGLNGLGIGIDCNGIYRNGIRYDLPEFGGVNIAVGYANDEVYDVALKYAGEVAGLTTMFNAGYAYNADGGQNVLGSSSETLQFQLGLMDAESGMFGTFAYQMEDVEDADVGSGDDTDVYHIKVGVKRAFNSYGDSAFYVDYGSYNDQYGMAHLEGVTGSQLSVLGFAAEQYFGGRFLMYAKYEIISLDVDGTANAQALYDGAQDLNLFQLGATFFF
ncbi:porin [Glaciecola sp. MF2-115]|uniref:porin n=1 Tax=Glaciecola sp. MF2-115 TaxID=3384827 RepID=UPI00399F2406